MSFPFNIVFVNRVLHYAIASSQNSKHCADKAITAVIWEKIFFPFLKLLKINILHLQFLNSVSDCKFSRFLHVSLDYKSKILW